MAAAVLVTVMALSGEDHTRIAVMVTFPALLVLVSRLVGSEWTSADVVLRRVEWWALVVVPPLIVWRGVVFA